MKRPTFRLVAIAAPLAAWMALAAVLGFATISSSIGLMATSAYLIAQAALHPPIAELSLAIVGVRFFGIARGLCRYLERMVSHHVTFRLLARWRTWVYAAVEPLAPARLQMYHSGDLLARIVSDVQTLEHFYVRAIAPPAVALLAAAGATALLGSFHPILAVMLLLFLLLGGVCLPLLVVRLSRPAGRQIVTARAALNTALVDGIQGIGDLLAFGQEGRHLGRVRALSSELARLQARMARIAGLHQGLAGLLATLGTAATTMAGIVLVENGQMPGVFLAVVALAVLASFEAVAPLPQAFQYLESSLEAARRLFEVVDARPAVTDPASPLPAPGRYELRISNLCFSYGPDQPAVLNGLSLDVPEGKQVAIVGPSGAGKTTLLNVLLRFWDYSSGQILLGGKELRDYAPEDVRRLIAVISQQTYLFNATVRENLLLARPDATQPDMIEAARQAQIHAWIQSLPQGYDTWIGEQGLKLSAGQRQRLAIARAILKDAPIVLLDEPTANLDAITEREVWLALRGLLAGRTSLMATHRLIGLETADEILVLQAGRVVERGRHHELMEIGGLYHRLWDLQHQTLDTATS